MRKEIVYFVVYDDPEYRMLLPFVKIGKAKNLHKRLIGLQVSSPIKLGVAGFIRSENAFVLEKVLHERYSKDLVIGEWFQRSPCMVKSLRANYTIEADRFDEFVDPEATCIENAPRAYYEPRFRTSEQLPKPIDTNNKKLDSRQKNWDYNSFKPLKIRR